MPQAANSALYSARLRFIEGLPARARELSGTAERLARDPRDLEALAILRRRLHALLASAQVFEERALSLAVQDLIARLDVVQRAERLLTIEEIDAVSVVVASLPTYVRPSQTPARDSDARELLQDHAAYSDVRELLRDDETKPASAGSTRSAGPQPRAAGPEPTSPDALAALFREGEPRVSTLPEFLAKHSAAKSSPAAPPEADRTETMRRVEPPAAGEPAGSVDPELSFGWSRAANFDAVAAGASPAPEAAPKPRVPSALSQSGVFFATAPPAPPARNPNAHLGVLSTAFATQRPAPESERDPVVDRTRVAEDEATDPQLDLPVLLKQTVSGLLPMPRRPVVLLVTEEVARATRAPSLVSGELELVQARDADEAVRLLHERAPDLVLLSAAIASSPEADLVRRLKSDPLSPASSVHVVFSEDATFDDSFLAQVGADGILREPLTAETLRPLLPDLPPLAALSEAEAGAAAVREGTIDEIATQIADEIRRGIAESLRVGKNETVHVGDGSELMAAAWSAVGRVRSHLAEQNRGRVRFRDDERRPSSSLLPAVSPDFPPEQTSPKLEPISAAPSDGDTAAALAARAPSVHPSQLLAGCRVLVADDDPAVLWFFAGLLREASAQVLQAHNGREALELARRKQPHVIVSDILMPKLDGFGLCRELKRDALLAHVPVILLSWKDDLLQRMRELDAGAAAYLRKEAGSQQILSQLAEVLLPRTKLIAKLRGHAEVSGAIDELGVFSLLELVAAERPDARLLIRDRSSLFEVDIRAGRKLFVTRTAADGAYTRGDKALLQLLGVSAGEFEVSSSASPLKAVLSEPLDRALSSAGRRLAAQLDAVSDARLLRVASIAFDDEVLPSVLAAGTVRSARLSEVASYFQAGTTTAEGVLREGLLAPAELESSLRELVRAGAISAVSGADGEDLVAAAQRERESPQLALLSSPLPQKPSGWAWPATQTRDRVAASQPAPPEEIAAQPRSGPPPAAAELDEVEARAAEPPEPERGLEAPPPRAVQPADGEAEPQPERDPDADIEAKASEPPPAPSALIAAKPSETARAVVHDPHDPHDRETVPSPEVSAELHAKYSRTVPGLGPAAAEALAAGAPRGSAEPTADAVTSAELENLNLPLPGVLARARQRSELLSLIATLLVLAAVGYFGWQALKSKPEPEPHLVMPQPTAAEAEPAAPAQPAMSNTQFGKVLPFVDRAHGIAVAPDQGLLVVEYRGNEPPPNVRVGERDLGKPPLAVALAPGRHELVLRTPKSTSFRYLIVRAGETRVVSLPLADL